MKEYLTQLGIEYMILIGALVGSILALKKSKENTMGRITTVLTSMIGSVYLTPLACYYLAIEEEKLRLAIAILLAFGGIVYIDRLFELIFKKLENGDIK